MKKNKKIIFSAIISFVLIAAMALTFCACGKSSGKSSISSVGQSANLAELGKGKTEFNFNVYDSKGSITSFVIHTDKKTVGEALLDLDLIAGDDSDTGLYVKKVNGITADYDVDKTYWAFYVDGEYANSSVSKTEIVAGSTYEFKVEK